MKPNFVVLALFAGIAGAGAHATDTVTPQCSAAISLQATQRAAQADEMARLGRVITQLTPLPAGCVGSVPAVNAQNSAPTSSTITLPGDYNSVCGDVLKRNGTVSAQTGDENLQPLTEEQQQQKLQYCQAAESARRAAKANDITSKVWMGVAGVCTADCFTLLSGGAACTFADLAGMGTDMAVTRDFTSALMSMGGLAMSNPGMRMGVGGAAAGGSAAQAGLALNSTGQAVTTTSEMADGSTISVTSQGLTGTGCAGVTCAATSGQQTQGAAAGSSRGSIHGAACLAAAMAGVQSLMKAKASGDQDDIYKTNFEAAKKIIPTVKTTTFASAPRIGGSGGTAGGGGSSGGGSNALTSSSTADKCEKATTTGVAVQCAVATDPNMASILSQSPKLLGALDNPSGGGALSSLLNTEAATAGGSADAEKKLTAAMGASLPSGSVATLAAAIKAVDTRIDDASGSAYASGGGGGRGGAGSGDAADPMMQAMQNLLAGLGPKDGSAPAASMSAVALANMKRSPASIVEDRNLNIFDRVTFRYAMVANRVLPTQQKPAATQRQ